MTAGLTACYTEFDPNIESNPVLCMNSEIKPGEPITIFLTRTWNWAEGDENRLDINVRDAEVNLFVNGELKEKLTQTVIQNPSYHPGGPYPPQRECYQSEYIPESGDIIRLEATSVRYGDATAAVTIPYPVPLDKIETQLADCVVNGNISDYPVISQGCILQMNLKLLAYFSDPYTSTDFYDLKVDYSSYTNQEDDTFAFVNSYIEIDFSGEPLMTEHVSVLESTIALTSGYTVFSDRQINGLTYPVHIGFNNFSFVYRNPSNIPEPKECGIQVILRHIDPSYYKHVISVWEANDGIVGALGGVGLANPVYPYSNVSTGAGVVAAYAESSMTIPFLELIAIAQQGIFK